MVILKYLPSAKKVYEYLVTRKIKVARRYDELIDKFDSSTVNNLAATLMTDFNNKKYDRVEVIYHQFKMPPYR